MTQQEMLMMIMNMNPSAKDILKELQDSGLSAKDFFYKKAEEKGINPEDILKKLL